MDFLEIFDSMGLAKDPALLMENEKNEEVVVSVIVVKKYTLSLSL